MPDTETRLIGGKALVLATAKQAAVAGWEPRDEFNIVAYYRDAFDEVLELLRAASLVSVYARKGDRKLARRLKHDLYKVAKDMISTAREWEAEVEAAVGFGADWTGDLPIDAEGLFDAVRGWAEQRRPEVAINAARSTRTVRRASLLIRCCQRLEAELDRQFTDPSRTTPSTEKCLAPVERARVGVAGSPASPVTRDVPGEDVEQGEIVELVSEGERVRGNEEEGQVSTPGAARSRASRAYARGDVDEDDGWEG